jgi:RNA polymerase sigma-70 factor, ECF subfamily
MDAEAFAAAAEPYRRQLHVHCYRMLGSFDEAEDLVQETLLRAWRAYATFEGRSQFRTWLYRIATNACLTELERRPRRVLPQDVVAPVTAATNASEAHDSPAWAPEIPWLQPYPDTYLDPEALAVSRESIELAFLAALQHLPARQRAILVLRDVLDWSASETAALLETTIASVNSAHQRARATMRSLYSAESAARSSEADQAALRKFMEAWDAADNDALIRLLREDARWAMPPAALWFDGRDAIARLYSLYPISFSGEFKMVATAANRQPAAAAYLRARGESGFRLVAVHVLRVVDGAIAEVTTFHAEICGAFDLPATLDF